MASKAWDSSLRLPGLILESRTVIDGTVEMSGRLAAEGANCPDCAMPSKSLHSRYDRKLSDLPVSGSTVRLRLSVRRFRCLHTPCPRRTFSEPLAPPVGRRYPHPFKPAEILAAHVRGVCMKITGPIRSIVALPLSSLFPVNWHGRLAPCLPLEASQTGSGCGRHRRQSSARGTGVKATGVPPYQSV